MPPDQRSGCAFAYLRVRNATAVQPRMAMDRDGNAASQDWRFARGNQQCGGGKAFGVRPFGTMAHEFLQAFQALVALPDFQRAALEAWMQEYRGDLGIALSDVVGMDAFLRDFDLLFSKAYDGCRHDSGDPFEWGEKLIAHYIKMGIDPMTKAATFSDSLDVPRAIALARHFQAASARTMALEPILPMIWDSPRCKS